MSSSTNIAAFRIIVQQINIYGGLFLFITGIFGELLNLIIFTTLKTFRQTTCAFYLIVNAIGSIGILVSLLLRIIYDGFNIGSYYTPLWCKLRNSLVEYCGLVCLTSMCLTTINQFLSMTNYKRWNSPQNARRSIVFACVFWFIYEVFTFLYYDSYPNVCIITNTAFAKYYIYFHLPIIFMLLPVTIMTTFSLLAFFKIRTIASRQINIVRLSRDRQLTAMTLFRVLIIVITSIPYIVFYIHTVLINTKDSILIARNQVLQAITLHFYLIGYVCSFYIYCCVSKRFRKQVIYVLFHVHLNRWQRRINNNRIIPHSISIEMVDRHHRVTTTLPGDIALY